MQAIQKLSSTQTTNISPIQLINICRPSPLTRSGWWHSGPHLAHGRALPLVRMPAALDQLLERLGQVGAQSGPAMEAEWGDMG